jgi:hypothetical protein
MLNQTTLRATSLPPCRDARMQTDAAQLMRSKDVAAEVAGVVGGVGAVIDEREFPASCAQ